MFCGSCGTLGYYTPEGTLNCSKCGIVADVPQEITLVTGQKVDLKSSMKSSIMGSEMRIYAVVEKLKLPTSDAYACPECGERCATCELRQMDQTDEPEVAFLQCQACSYGWRQ